jgi:predicted nucleic-acid-binding Zn-ribbon protein
MRYKAEDPPYDHTCPRCGRHQQVYEYDEDPSFEVGEVNEFRDGDDPGIDCQMVVDLERQFKCIACGYVEHFDSDYVDTGVEVTMVLRDEQEKPIEINSAVRKVKRKFRKENDIEDYL